MHSVDIIFLAYCVYVPCLVLLYLAEIWIIVKPGSQFKSPFYILFLAAAIDDLIMVVDSFHEIRMEFFPLVNGMFENYDCVTCTQIRVTISYICPFAQDLLNVFIAFNRFTSIRLAARNVQIWKTLLPIAIFISFLIPTVIIAPSAFRNMPYIKFELPHYVMYLVSPDSISFMPWLNIRLITLIEIALTNFIIVILYSISAMSLRKLVGSKKTLQQERRLLKFGIVNTVISVGGLFFQAMQEFQILPMEWTFSILHLFGLQLDLKCFSAAIILIIVNKSFRDELLKFLRFSRNKNPEVNISVTESRMVMSEVRPSFR